MNPSSDPPTKSQSTVAEELEKFLGPKRKADAELSGAFQQTVARAPDLEHVHKLQVQTRDRVESLEHLVGSLKRTLLVLTCSVMALVLTCAAASVLLYQRWDAELANQKAVASAAETVNPQVAGNAASNAVTPPMVMEREPLSEADEAIYPLILDLHRRALRFQRSTSPGSVSSQIDSSATYIEFLTEATNLAEKAAKDNVSQDLSLAIVKIVELAKLSRSQLGGERLETDLIDDQIRAILRRYIPRDERYDPTRM